jgi:DNA-binding NtrC family response regulator
MRRNRVLLVDDDTAIRSAMRDFLQSRGYEVGEASSCHAARDFFRVTRPDAAVLDYRLPDGTALELLPQLRELDDGVPLIILTGHGTIDLAVRAMKEGAEQFLTKPLELSALLVVLERCMENLRNRQKQYLAKTRQRRNSLNPFLGSSAVIRDLADQAMRVLTTESPTLIQGETGTGKGVLARWLHECGPRAEEPFVDLNCAGLSREFLETELFGHEKGAFTGAVNAKLGLLEVADKGTVFLDEIGDVDAQVQPKLLKVLEERTFRRLGDVRDRHVDVHLIAATHADLAVHVRENRFRSDLYFRISTIPLRVPSLRDRVEDIPLLAGNILQRTATDLGRGEVTLENSALDALKSYSWPGNIRELRNVLERALLLKDGNSLRGQDLRFDMPAAPVQAWSTDLSLADLERRQIELVLQQQRGRVEKAANVLGISRSSLYQKIKEYNLSGMRARYSGL